MLETRAPQTRVIGACKVTDRPSSTSSHLQLTGSLSICLSLRQLTPSPFVARQCEYPVSAHSIASQCGSAFAFDFLLFNQLRSAMAAAATPPGVVDPTKPAKYPIILSDALLGKSPKEILTALKCERGFPSSSPYVLSQRCRRTNHSPFAI